MTANLVALVVALALMAGIAYALIRSGRIKEREKQQRENLDAVGTAREVERDVAREPDPVGRLRDKWRRPVPGKRTDSD